MALEYIILSSLGRNTSENFIKEDYSNATMTTSYALRKFYETIMSAEGSRDRYGLPSSSYNNFEERTHFI